MTIRWLGLSSLTAWLAWTVGCTCGQVYQAQDALVSIEFEGEVMGQPFTFTHEDGSIATPLNDDGIEGTILVTSRRAPTYDLLIEAADLPIIEGTSVDRLTFLRFGSEAGTNWGMVGGQGERFETLHVGENPSCEFTFTFEAMISDAAISYCSARVPTDCVDWVSGFGAMQGTVTAVCPEE